MPRAKGGFKTRRGRKKMMDRIGKESLLNGKLLDLKNRAIKNDPKLQAKVNIIFEDNNPDQVMEDLREGKLNYETKLLLFHALSGTQPISRLEVPEAYHKANAGKLFYALKTYQIKLLDIYRNDIFKSIVNGKTKAEKLEGYKKLARLTSALIILGSGTDAIKDWLLQREKLDLEDRVFDNMLRLFGFSKYTAYQVRKEGLGRGLYAQFARYPGFGDSDAARRGRGAPPTASKRGSSRHGGTGNGAPRAGRLS